MDNQSILTEIFEKSSTLGDLPVFSTTVNRICAISSDPQADAMELAQQIMNDANLSMKMLKLANSSFYNRSNSKISAVSRSVVLLGFDTIKNLCLTFKLIESFQHERPGIDMDKLLVQAYITAGFTRDLAIRSGLRDIEETYICALLHNLGEISIGYFMPDKFIEIQQRNRDNPKNVAHNERTVLGLTTAAIGQQLAESWNFSNKVVTTMSDDLPRLNAGVARSSDFNHVTAAMGSMLVGALYGTPKYRNHDFNATLVKLSKAIGITLNDVEAALSNSFKMSYALAREYNLDAKKIIPPVADTQDEARDRMVRQLAYFATSERPQRAEGEDQNDSSTDEAFTSEHTAASGVARVDQSLQLQYIQDITALITDKTGFNVVLGKVLEGLLEAVGFRRVVLAVLSVDRKHYSARIAMGADVEALQAYFNRPIAPTKDVFSQMIKDGMDLVASDLSQPPWRDALPAEFLTKVKPAGFLASSLRSGMRPLGFIYADNGEDGDVINNSQQRGFVQFLAQARLALQTGH